jgi:hypothetical protein
MEQFHPSNVADDLRQKERTASNKRVCDDVIDYIAIRVIMLNLVVVTLIYIYVVDKTTTATATSCSNQHFCERTQVLNLLTSTAILPCKIKSKNRRVLFPSNNLSIGSGILLALLKFQKLLHHALEFFAVGISLSRRDTHSILKLLGCQ